MNESVGFVRGVTLDVGNRRRAERFWTAVLGIDVTDRYDTYSWLAEVSPGVRLILQEVPEPKRVKNRMHLELTSPDPDGLIERVLSLGGRKVEDVHDPSYDLTVMADPDGNEFCVLRRLSAAIAGGAEMP